MRLLTPSWTGLIAVPQVLSLRHAKALYLGLDGFQYFGVRLWFNLPRLGARRIVRLWFTALRARRTIGSAGGIKRLALFAIVMRDAVRTKLVAGVAERILVLLAWFSGAVSAPHMTAIGALLAARREEGLALMTGPAHTLAMLLEHQVLTTRFAGPLENEFLLVLAVVGDDRGVLLVRLDESGPPLATGNRLLFRALGRIASALGAARVLAIGALLLLAEGCIASVASPANTHTNRLIDAEDRLVRGRVHPFRGRQLQTEALAEFLGTLLEQLLPGHFGNTIHRFQSSPCSGRLLLRRHLTWLGSGWFGYWLRCWFRSCSHHGLTFGRG